MLKKSLLKVHIKKSKNLKIKQKNAISCVHEACILSDEIPENHSKKILSETNSLNYLIVC